MKNIVECYVVRIYRREAKNASRIQGVVERPEGDAVRIFHSAEELLEGIVFPRRKTGFNAKKRAIGKRV